MFKTKFTYNKNKENNSKCYFGNKVFTKAVVKNSSFLTCLTPSKQSIETNKIIESANVSVVFEEIDYSNNSFPFRFYSPAVINSITPNTILNNHNYHLNISGENFSNGCPSVCRFNTFIEKVFILAFF